MVLRKAEAGSSIMLIGMAVGILLIIGMYLFYSDMASESFAVQDNVFSGLTSAADELSKS